MGTPRKAWSGPCHRNPPIRKVMSILIVGTERPRPLATVPAWLILHLSSSPEQPRHQACVA